MSELERRSLLRRGAAIEVLLLQVDHPLGIGRFWSGTGGLDYNGQTWTGWGVIGEITEVVSSTEIEVTEVSFALSGVDPDLVDGLDQPIKGRTAQLYEALLDQHYRVVDVRLRRDMTLDYRQFRIADDGKATIRFNGRAGWKSLANRSAAKLGPEEARAVYADETGYDEVHLVENQQDRWAVS